MVINDPKNGYYGALVAGPPFREIADRVYAGDTRMYDAIKEQKLGGNPKVPIAKTGQKKASQSVYKSLGIKARFANGEYVSATDTNGVSNREVKFIEGKVPDVNGMSLKDALYIIGNSGLRPLVKGSGKVVKQSLTAGLSIIKGHPIVLELE